MKQRILITGGAGFVGSHLAHDLLAQGHQVRVLDNFSPQVHGSNQELPELIRGQVELMRGDVRSREDMKRALDGMETVFHFAASVGVGQSMYEIHSYIDNNNLGTANLLQCLIEKPVGKLVIASSMSIYGEGPYRDARGQVHNDVRRTLDMMKEKAWEPTDATGATMTPLPTPEEKAPDNPSIYALSKYDQERMCLLYGRAYNVPTVALRFFNIFGRGQALSNPYTGVLAIFGSRLLNGKPPILFEDGHQLRDFVHISDIVQACRLAMEKPEAVGLAFNVASGSRRTVREVAAQMAQAMGKNIEGQVTGEYRMGDIRHCFADIEMARQVLGYRPAIDFDTGIADLVEWLATQQAVDRSEQMRSELAARGLAL